MIPERATAAARGKVSSLFCSAEINPSANVARARLLNRTIRKIAKCQC
jgi:hypothetical protein